MKKFYIILIFGITLTCSNDQEIAETVNPLEGNWHMINLRTGFLAQPLELGEIIWKFDIDNDKLLIENTTNPEGNPLYLLETGEYDMTVVDQTLTMLSVFTTIASTTGEELFYEIELNFDFRFQDEGEILVLDGGAEGDGPLIRFQKVD
ncbi:hypothetical protein [Winogradskyella sp. UBA3174]|uniref:hypothetical protein n=1 Tax=Winogradskyella sp. UBA3174 TaxID=1947785 RepID=UPI0025E0DEDA|nr:hypothetical protein [Winogradskyella sp. UBA3174]|tara:strand:- start:38521 stop:38967 length:447 start_codon:yes stop_codon:yes gene_type:complete